MNRQPEPCSACARFRPGETEGTCTGYEKPRRADDTNEACPLWSERRAGAGTTHKAAEGRMGAGSHGGAGPQPGKAETRPFRARAQQPTR